MTLTPEHRPPLGEEVIDKLRAMVQSGEWPLQQRIPAEPELMTSLGVSRGTLREAIKALSHSGLLEVRRGDGTYVRATSEISGAARRIYREHTHDHVLQVRVGLDTQAARLATTHATAADLDRMRELLAARAAAWAAGDYQGWADADWSFHEKVAQASGNPLLHELYESFGPIFRTTLLDQRGRDGFRPVAPEGHEDLIAALQARDVDAAVASVAANLNA